MIKKTYYKTILNQFEKILNFSNIGIDICPKYNSHNDSTFYYNEIIFQRNEKTTAATDEFVWFRNIVLSAIE